VKLNAESMQEQLQDSKMQLKEAIDANAKLEADLKLSKDQVEEQMMRGLFHVIF
jgi:hypothetical protein